MAKETLLKLVEKNWDKRKWLGRNMLKVADAAIAHPQSSLGKILHFWNAQIKAADVGKAKEFSVKLEERPEPAEKGKKLGKCLLCRTPLRFGTRISANCNGKKLDFGGAGNLVGDRCLEHITYIMEAASHSDFEMYEIGEDDARTQSKERIEKVMITLDQLSKKEIGKLQAKGYNLHNTISTEAVKEIQKALREGDYSRLERELDLGGDMITWAVRALNDKEDTIYDPDVRYTVIKMQKRPDLIRSEEWAQFLLFQWQERPHQADGEIGGIREDIEYLAKLPKSHELVQEYGKVDLRETVKPVKIFSKAKWKNVSLGKLIRQDSVTKAQSKAIKFAVPRLAERRADHNREVMNSYCNPAEFNTLLKDLRKTYDHWKGEYTKQKKQGIERPHLPWKGYKLVKDFFELEDKVKALNDVSTRSIVLQNITMPNAGSVVKNLYVEGRKVQLANHLDDEDVLGKNYISLQEAAKGKLPEFEERLEKFLGAAISYDEKHCPKEIKRRLQKAGIKPETLKKLYEDLKVSAEFGLVEKKYTYKDRLNKVLKITEDFEEIDKKTQKSLDYLVRLQDSVIKLQIKNLSANTGMQVSTNPRFSLESYVGKRFISAKQKEAIAQVMKELPDYLQKLSDTKLKAEEERYEKAKKYFAEHEVYTNWTAVKYGHESTDLRFVREELPETSLDYGFDFLPIDRIKEKGRELGRYRRLDDKTRQKLRALTTDSAKSISWGMEFPDNLEEVLAKDNVVVSPGFMKAVEEKHKYFQDKKRQAAKVRQQLEKEGYDLDQLRDRLTAYHNNGWRIKKPRSMFTSDKDILDILGSDVKSLWVDDAKALWDKNDPSQRVITQGYELYRNASYNRFLVIAFSDRGNRNNKEAFGTRKDEEGKVAEPALMRYNPSTRNVTTDFGKRKIWQNQWYKTVNRNELDLIITRAVKYGSKLMIEKATR